MYFYLKQISLNVEAHSRGGGCPIPEFLERCPHPIFSKTETNKKGPWKLKKKKVLFRLFKNHQEIFLVCGENNALELYKKILVLGKPQKKKKVAGPLKLFCGFPKKEHWCTALIKLLYVQEVLSTMHVFLCTRLSVCSSVSSIG